MITVHVGLHKTGSSAIQAALRMVTHRRGLLVSEPVFDGDRLDCAWADRVRAEGHRRHVVISSEALLGDPFEGYAAASARAEDLRGRLSAEGMQVVVYLRPQTEWIPSVYLQAVQQGETVEPSTFWDRLKVQPNLRWAHLVGCLAEVFSGDHLVVRPYVAGTDVVQDFFRTAGLGTVPAVSGGAILQNVSISPVQAPIMRALNSDPSLTREQRASIRTFFQTVVAPARGGNFSPLPPDVQREILSEFDDDWQRVTLLLKGSDGSADFERVNVRAGADLREYVPALAMNDPAVAELLRVVRDLALRDDLAREPSAWQRALSKAQTNPRDVPFAIVRRLQRHDR